MISRPLKNLFAAVACVFALPAAGHAADMATPVDTSGWTFTLAAYGWAAGIDGEAGILGLEPVELDLSFSDLLEKLDFAFMGLGEARNGNFVLGVDLTYTSISADVDVPLPPKVGDKVDLGLDATSTVWMVTGFGGYSLIKNDQLTLDAIAGARMWSVDTELQSSSNIKYLDGRSADDSATWVDPLVGTKLRFDMTDNVYAAAWGMVGGFGVGSDMMWDVMAGAGYSFNEHFDLFAGYRAVSVDYEDDGFVYDVVQQGPVVAGVFRF